jgi:hypothetical protein
MINEKSGIEIKELILAKADWSRTYIGTIERFSNHEGNPFVVGKVEVNGYKVVCQASDEKELRESLDDMVILILDYNLHGDSAVTSSIEGTDFFHN